jgi:hypothetical protein
MAAFRIEVTYLVVADSDTEALVKLYKAAYHHNDAHYLESITITDSESWLKPKTYKQVMEDEGKPIDDDE